VNPSRNEVQNFLAARITISTFPLFAIESFIAANKSDCDAVATKCVPVIPPISVSRVQHNRSRRMQQGHLHLDQRVAQRLLSRFRSQGFIHHDLSRACLAQPTDSIPRVILLGRLSLYGHGEERLHEELVPITARWIEPSQRKGPLVAYAQQAETKTLDLLERSLGGNGLNMPGSPIQRRLLDSAQRDIDHCDQSFTCRYDLRGGAALRFSFSDSQSG
jgi:hypothetical protein